MIITDEMVEAGCSAYVKEMSDQIGQNFSWPGVYREVEKGRIRALVRAAVEGALSVASATTGTRPDVDPLTETFR